MWTRTKKLLMPVEWNPGMRLLVLLLYVDQNLRATHACGMEYGNETILVTSEDAEPRNYSCLWNGVWE